MIHRLTPLRSAFVLSLVLCSLGSNDSSAAEEAAKITFEDHVYPILDSKCLNCHNTDEAKGGLDLSSFGAAMTGGSGGEIVLSGDPKASRLYTLAAHLEEPLMPPKGTSATEAEMKVIADWITGGLLETKNSTAKKATKPKVDLNSITSTGKPDGPPAMPEHLILEPSLVTDRPNSVPALAHSPWAPILAVAGQKQILLYHSSDFDLLGVLPYPEGFPRTLSFSPNGAYLFCGGGRGLLRWVRPGTSCVGPRASISYRQVPRRQADLTPWVPAPLSWRRRRPPRMIQRCLGVIPRTSYRTR